MAAKIGHIGVMAENKRRKFVGISMQSYDLTSGMSCIPLGVVLTDDGKETLDKFKIAVSSGVLFEQSRFLFATSNGHYISEEMSRVLTVADVVKDGTVYITKQHDPSRDPPILCGVVAQPGDLPMGYFTCSMNATLSTAREAILEQVAHKDTLENAGFLFLYEKWPVSVDQESVLALYDVLDGKQVFIQFKLSSAPSAMPMSLSKDSLEDTSKPTAALLAAASLATSHKRVYLSYVSDETSAHADALQSSLKKLGLKVYTKQSNQASGESSSSESSEQEYSNKYIQKAAVFVPIVSSRYGETSVTNLEVKYADSLEKFIVPLNLNLHWPPNCLAVQFASVNYIRWKTKELVEKQASTMAEGIVEVMQMNQEALNSKPSKVLSKGKSICGEKSLVVVICHSVQASFLEHVKEVLEKKNYTVWSSLELEDSGVHISNSVFQKKVRDSCLVVCIISKRFCSSRTCEQLVYYCQHRKTMLPVLYEDVEMPYWVSTLVGTQDFIDGRGHTFDDLLCKNVKLELSSATVSTNRREERETRQLQQELFSRLPDGNYVYISGGHHFYSTNGEAICKLLGKELAKLKSVVLVTDGFYGVGDTVAKSFHDKRKKLGLPINIYCTTAVKDPADRSRKTRQREDGTMEPSPYGETIFLGNSLRQCGRVCTRVFNICILIEGGPSSAYQVQQLTWNGAVVIPVKSTGGAASGKFLVPSSIYRPPVKVSESDWSMLSNDAASVEDTVASLVRIVQVCFQITDSKKNPKTK